MIEEKDRRRVMDALPLLARLDDELRQDFMRSASLARLPAGRDLMAEGDRVEAIPIVIRGAIRVYKIGESGREITLYRFSTGECCVLTANSILGNQLFPACAQVEEEVEVALVPAAALDRWLAVSPVWRQFIFEAMSRRLMLLLETLDGVAFRRLDVRVAGLLADRAGNRPAVLQITHHEIADELGSSREVISRILEDLQGRGLIHLARGRIEIRDLPALQSLSVSD